MALRTTLRKPIPASRPKPVTSLRRVFGPDDDERGESTWIVGTGTTSIGRGTPDGIALAGDPYASRHHADLVVRPDGSSHVVDRSSSGTYVNGRAVAEAGLADGDLIRMGDSFFVLRYLRDAGEESGGAVPAALEALVGYSPAMVAVRRTLMLLARSNATVLVLGETGTGKELVARAVHALSGRPGAFAALNCAAIPEQLAESQLFGHVRGAFTGAQEATAGIIEAAHRGTLFLDEVGELSATVQPKLLRVLEDRVVTRVGATRGTPSDVRLVAATNRDVAQHVRAGDFRADLYGRLAEFTIELPPLRERREDILPILRHLAPTKVEAMEPALVDALLQAELPLNARDLRRIALQLSLKAPGGRWALDDLGHEGLSPLEAAPVQPQRAAEREMAAPETIAGPQERSGETQGAVPDRDELEALLRRFHGIIADIARHTGRSRKQVYRWIEQHGLDASHYRA